MSRLLSSTALALLLAASGCVGQLQEGGEHVDRISGSLGEVTFSGTPELREMRVSERELVLDLRIQDALGHWAMIRLEIPRDADAETGSTSLALRTDGSEVIGCSGPDDGDWEFDCKPEELDVTASERAGTVTVDFDGFFAADTCHDLPEDAPEEGQPFEGSVEVDLI